MSTKIGWDVDVLVCGGGPAGIAAAIASAETGKPTLLIEQAGRLGGTGVNAMVNTIPLWTRTPYVLKLHSRIAPHQNDCEFLDLAYADLVQASGAKILLHATIFDVLLTQNKDMPLPAVSGVRLATPSGPLEVQAKRVIDATADGVVAFLAGADFEMGRESDGLMQPATIMFRVSGVNHAQSMEANGGRDHYQFPEGSWNHRTMAARDRGELPWNVGMVRTYSADRDGDRFINATQVNYINGVDINDLTRGEFEGRRQVKVIMEFLRKYAPGFQDAYVSLMPAVLGVRETRRFRGLAKLTREDCLSGRICPDAITTECTAPLDAHNPAGPGQAEGVSAAHPAGMDPKPQPYDIPYGCLVPEKVNGLLLAGRCISGTHDANSSYRWQSICLGTGAAAGFAAAESLHQQVQPRDIHIQSVQQRLGIVRNA